MPASALVLGVALVAASGASTLRVGASQALASCVEQAAGGWSGPTRTVVSDHQSATGAVDVFVGAAVEVTRLIESGEAVEGSERPLPEIPWVVSGAADLAGLEAADGEVVVLGGAAGHEARLQLQGRLANRTRPSLDPERLRAARLRIVPASLRADAATVKLDWPPLRAQAVVLTNTADPDAAAAFVTYLSGGAGREAFGTCAGSAVPPLMK